MGVGKVLAIGAGVVLGVAATSTLALALWLRDPPEHDLPARCFSPGYAE